MQWMAKRMIKVLWQEDDENAVANDAVFNHNITDYENPYDGMITVKEWDLLFRQSDDEGFYKF